MKVFISWSGDQSKKLADKLRDWLPNVLQLVKPYFTPADIDKGSRWATEIAKELESSEVGILCVTRDNLHSDWIMFEAGALSKSLDKAHVCPILFGITNTDLAGPLKQFQTTEFVKSEIHKLMTVINNRLGEHKLPVKTFEAVFEKWWPELEEQIRPILEETKEENPKPLREDRELLEEVVELTRSIAKRDAQNISPLSPKAVVELIEKIIQLHDDQAVETGGYIEVLKMLQEMRRPVVHIAKHARPSLQLRDALENYDALSYEMKYIRPVDNNNTDDDIPF